MISAAGARPRERPERLKLPRRQGAPLPWPESPQPKRTEPGPAEIQYGVAESLAESPHLPVTPGGHSQAKPRGPLRPAEKLHIGRTSGTVLENRAAAEAADAILSHPPLHFDFVYPGNLISRVEKTLGQLTVVCQEKEPFGVDVQAPDGEEPDALTGHQI